MAITFSKDGRQIILIVWFCILFDKHVDVASNKREIIKCYYQTCLMFDRLIHLWTIFYYFDTSIKILGKWSIFFRQRRYILLDINVLHWRNLGFAKLQSICVHTICQCIWYMYWHGIMGIEIEKENKEAWLFLKCSKELSAIWLVKKSVNLFA